VIDLNTDLEELVSILENLPNAIGGDRQARTLVHKRLHLCRGNSSEFELFIEGNEGSFGSSISGKLFSWGEYHDTNDNRQISALVIKVENRSGHSRLLAHVAYESERLLRDNPSINNEELLLGIEPFLSLIVQSHVMPITKQMGLTGELILMERILNFANENNINHSRVLNCWKGYLSADRDYYSNGFAIEVKASGSGNRNHIISSINQLLLGEEPFEERLFVYSIGLIPDASREYRLVTQIDNVIAILESSLHDDFFDLLENYCGEGYHRSLRQRYSLESGFTVSPSPGLIEIDDSVDILRYSSFQDGELPDAVDRVKYTATLDSIPILSADEINAIFKIMLDIDNL